jgi:putative selenate reductase
MESTSLTRLLGRIAGEHRAKASIFDIPEAAYRQAFELEASSPGLDFAGTRVSLPVGPAAGPHSQIAPNLVAAYLAGARVFELKTVQENDALDIEKPCIWALDEGHNTEWSTELTLDAAREEYLRGWIAIHLLAAMLSPSPRAFAFNASVGYTLEGIRGAKVDAFIEGLRSPASDRAGGFWNGAMRDLEAFLDSGALASSFGAEAEARARGLMGRPTGGFPDSPVSSITLSTMHGCPPDEIERIASYLIEEKGIDVSVKLNPTLLGYDEVRRILDAAGWTGIRIDRGLFERDLKMPDALSLIGSLSRKAEARGRRFGIKLSNTLANANAGGFLPGAERYMSGRALFPVTVRLAAAIAAALPDWPGRFSYCGGASALNAGELVAAGLGPITVATDILKPGGYLRLTGAARAAVAALAGSPGRPDAAALARLADSALARPEYRADWKSGNASIRRALPLFDCFAAPCVEACPVGQKVPEYIRLGAAGEAAEAFRAIVADNPLPRITGTLCDHVCQAACSRNDYEGPVQIRAAKLACAVAAAGALEPPARPRTDLAAGKAAIVGAGPAGLSCARGLALAGVPVTVFDEDREPGGVPANVIPKFRIDRGELAADIDRIRALGVEFRLGVRVESLDRLEAEGYSSIFVGAGAPSPRRLELSGEGVAVVDAVAFLEAFSRAAEGGSEAGHPFPGARRIVVAGGGNTAMDAARVALRLPGVEDVAISYRRGRAEMPADREELENALGEGARLIELTLPERASPASGGGGPWLSLRIMALGEPDPSGRRAPVPTDRSSAVECDLLVAALGETPDRALFERLGLPLGGDGKPIFDEETLRTPRAGTYVGGDAARGPSSIISAAADGSRAARAILAAAGLAAPERGYAPPPPDPRRLAARGAMVEGLRPEAPLFLEREAERCLACDSACLRCVEVCPNRANTALAAGGAFAQSLQILHVDALCNECGNCGLFCPYEGEPYRDKATLFEGLDAMGRSRNVGFAVVAGAGGARLFFREAEGGPVAEARPGWEAGEGAASLVELARIVVRDHAYLLGGER